MNIFRRRYLQMQIIQTSAHLEHVTPIGRAYISIQKQCRMLFLEIPSQRGQNDFEVQGQWPLFSIPDESIPWCMFGANLVIPAQICDELSFGQGKAGVYTKFSLRLSEEPFPWLIQKFPCTLIFKTGQLGCQLNLSRGQIRLDLTSGRLLD